MGDGAEGRRVRILRVTNELLCEVLHLPPGTRIVSISHETYFDTDETAFKVEHPSFGAVVPGSKIPEVRPLYTMVQTAKFDGWGG